MPQASRMAIVPIMVHKPVLHDRNLKVTPSLLRRMHSRRVKDRPLDGINEVDCTTDLRSRGGGNHSEKVWVEILVQCRAVAEDFTG